MEHLYTIMTRNVAGFILLSTLSPHAKMLSKLNSMVPFQPVYVQEKKWGSCGFILSDFRQ